MVTAGTASVFPRPGSASCSRAAPTSYTPRSPNTHRRVYTVGAHLAMNECAHLSTYTTSAPAQRKQASSCAHVREQAHFPIHTHLTKDAAQQPLHCVNTLQRAHNINTVHIRTRHIHASHHCTMDISQHVPSSPCVLLLNTCRGHSLTLSLLHHGCPGTRFSCTQHTQSLPGARSPNHHGCSDTTFSLPVANS